MHHKILEQLTLFKQPSSWENCAGWFTTCKQKWYMDLPGSACAPRFTYISTIFGCHTISSDYQSRTVWTHSTWTYISLGAGEILTFWHHMKLTIPAELWGHITHILVYLWGILLDGWWDDRKRNQKPVLPLYLRLDIPSNLSRALSCLRLSGHNFLVQRMRYDRNRRPYELRICDRCDWHTIQDEEHTLSKSLALSTRLWASETRLWTRSVNADILLDCPDVILLHWTCPDVHFVGLSAWLSGQTSHTATAYLPTSIWGWPSSFEDLYEPTWYFWCCLFCS